MSRFLYGMITGAALLYVAMHFHVVRGSDGMFLVPKVSNSLSDVYVDIRQYGVRDWENHKPLAAAIMKSKQSQLVDDASQSSFRTSVNSLFSGLFGNNQ